MSNPVALHAEGASACFAALAHPAVEQAPAADGGGTEPAPDGIDGPVQRLPLLALPAVEQLALRSDLPGEPGRADAQEPQGQQVAADAAVEEGQFQLREQLAGKPWPVCCPAATSTPPSWPAPSPALAIEALRPAPPFCAVQVGREVPGAPAARARRRAAGRRDE